MNCLEDGHLTKCGVLILLPRHASLQHVLRFLLQRAQSMRAEQAEPLAGRAELLHSLSCIPEQLFVVATAAALRVQLPVAGHRLVDPMANVSMGNREAHLRDRTQQRGPTTPLSVLHPL